MENSIKQSMLPFLFAASLTSCGGSSQTPVSVQIGGTGNLSSPSTSADPNISVEGNDDTQTPPPSSEQTQLEPSPVAGPCVDTAPFNDGYGWNGVETCILSINVQNDPQTPQPEPTPTPTTTEPESTVFVPEGASHYDCGSIQQLVFVQPAYVQDGNGAVIGRYSIDEDDLEIRVGSNIYHYRIVGKQLTVDNVQGTTVLGTATCQHQSGPFLLPVQLTSNVGYLCSTYNDATTTFVWDFQEQGLYDEDNIKTGTWYKIQHGNEIVVAPNGGRETIIARELPDRTLRLLNPGGVEWGYCDTTAASSIPVVTRFFWCYENPHLPRDATFYTIFNGPTRVSDFSIEPLVYDYSSGAGVLSLSQTVTNLNSRNLSRESSSFYYEGFTDSTSDLPGYRVGNDYFYRPGGNHNQIIRKDGTGCTVLIE